MTLSLFYADLSFIVMDSGSVLDSRELSRKSLCFLLGLCSSVVDSHTCECYAPIILVYTWRMNFTRQSFPLCRTHVVGHFLYSGYSASFRHFWLYFLTRPEVIPSFPISLFARGFLLSTLSADMSSVANFTHNNTHLVRSQKIACLIQKKLD